MPTATSTPTIMHENVALGKPAYASSTFSSSYAPSLAFDNSFQTRYCPVDGSDNQWLLVDLLTIYQLTLSQVSFESNGSIANPWRYNIFSSSDNQTWNLVVDQSHNTQTDQTLQDALFLQARYMKMIVVIPAIPHWASIEEWKLFN